jgi:ribonuclease BN (tRNA processing enzyme)
MDEQSGNTTPAGAGGSTLRVTVLGSCGTYPLAGRACSGYLLEAAVGGRTATVWVDTGSGTLANLLRHVALPAVDAIWVSHLHIDHVSDLPVVNYALRFGGFTPRQVPVYGPAGWADHMREFVSPQSGDAVERTRDAIEQVFQVHELSDGQRVEIGPLELTAVATSHGVETYGVRASAGGHVVAYSADSGPCEALGLLAADAGLFLCEAAWQEWPQEAGPIHMTPQLAGEWAARYGAKQLVLTHLRAPTVPEVALQRASAAYGGEVSLALEDDVFQLGATS